MNAIQIIFMYETQSENLPSRWAFNLTPLSIDNN